MTSEGSRKDIVTKLTETFEYRNGEWVRGHSWSEVIRIDNYDPKEQKCSYCNGTGMGRPADGMQSSENICSVCRGSGKVPK
jgi:DnaJ-class molecular chaperone